MNNHPETGGTSGEELYLDSREDVERASQALVDQAKRSLMLYTADLEPAILNRNPFLDATQRFVALYRNATFRILILDSRKAVQSGHRLVELARKVGNQIEFRCPAEQARDFPGTFLLSDDRGFLHRPRADRFRGKANYNDPARNHSLGNYFEEIWTLAEPDIETRRLLL